MEKVKCDDCGTTKGIVGDLKGTLCADCMDKRSSEHFKYYLKKTLIKAMFTRWERFKLWWWGIKI